MNSNVKAARMARLVLRTGTLMACGLVASYVFADEQLRTENVKFQDLNVGTPAGVETLYGRIHSAAKRVCSETDRMEQARASACAKRAEAHAIGTLNMPLLTAYYQIKIGRTQALSANR
jgi:UrcA family protein